MKKTRRKFIQHSGQFALGLSLLGLASCGETSKEVKDSAKDVKQTVENAIKNWFNISLAQWSFHRTIRAGKMDNLDFAAKTKSMGIDGVEYVNQFFKDKAKDMAYLGEMKKRAEDNDVKSLLIMIDGEGGLGDPNETERKKAVENHYKWVEAAKFLGCHSIRVNAYGVGSAEEVSESAIKGLAAVSTFAKDFDINVIVENHGGYSSNGQWLANVMKEINMPNCGTLPDFGNFCIKRSEAKNWEDRKCLEDYDRYQGVTELMPYAKAVSAKTHDFDADGNETNTNYMKMMKIVKDAGYKGWVGIEYEGKNDDEEAGILASKKLLEIVRGSLS